MMLVTQTALLVRGPVRCIRLLEVADIILKTLAVYNFEIEMSASIIG